VVALLCFVFLYNSLPVHTGCMQFDVLVLSRCLHRIASNFLQAIVLYLLLMRWIPSKCPQSDDALDLCSLLAMSYPSKSVLNPLHVQSLSSTSSWQEAARSVVASLMKEPCAEMFLEPVNEEVGDRVGVPCSASTLSLFPTSTHVHVSSGLCVCWNACAGVHMLDCSLLRSNTGMHMLTQPNWNAAKRSRGSHFFLYRCALPHTFVLYTLLYT
jgi:hypothetical protein